MIPRIRGYICGCIYAGALALLLSGCSYFTPDPLPLKNELVVLTHPGPLTYDATEAEGSSPSGLEYDLIQTFAQEQGLTVRFIVVPRHEIQERLANHEAHLAAGWLTPDQDPRFTYSTPYFTSRDILVRHEASPPITRLEDLNGKTVFANKGSRQYRVLQDFQKQYPNLTVKAYPSETPLDLLAALTNREIETALVDKAILDIGLNFYPALGPGLPLGEPHDIAWMFPKDGDPRVFELAQAFIEKTKKDSTILYLQDRYLGHLERLTPSDAAIFINRLTSLLPKYQQYFKQAQLETGIDWRLLAALSYHESHWNPLATSRTGVRGIMMLTEETADRLGVNNRLNPAESIVAGARYVNMLRDAIPESTPEPDRTWQAIAAYNLGGGHFSAGRTIAKQKGADPNSWYEMKKILPLLARPEYYQRLKSGRARGGEAVIMVENVRLYYDIMLRHMKPYNPLENIQESMAGMAGMSGRDGMKRRGPGGLGTGLKPPPQ